MDPKWTEIAVLAGFNVASLIVVIVVNILTYYMSRNEDSEQTFRKYSVKPKRSSNISSATKLTGNSPTGVAPAHHDQVEQSGNAKQKQHSGRGTTKKHS